MVVLAGGDHSIKTLLLQTLAGVHAPASGKILLDGIDFYANRKVFASYIGYVPADLSLHANLTVQETLLYQAHLRMPRYTNGAERRQRVQEVLQIFDLQKDAGQRLSALTDGVRWRVSIAVELLNRPSILLVDSPAASIDPADEIKVTKLFQQQVEQEITVIQASNVTRCAQLADRVIILAKDGTLAWFGPAEEALSYFGSLVPAVKGTNSSFRLEDALDLLRNTDVSQTEPWAKRFQSSPAYAAYLDNPLNDKHPDLLLQNRPLTRIREASKDKIPPPKIPQISRVAKFNLLANRALRVLRRERTGLLNAVGSYPCRPDRFSVLFAEYVRPSAR